MTLTLEETETAVSTAKAPHAARAKLLAILQLPPPIHGAAVINQQVVASKQLHEIFDIEVLPIQAASAISDIGRFRLGKLWKGIALTLRLLTTLVLRRPDLAYYVLASPTGLSFYRDVVSITLLRMFGTRVVFHCHSKGFGAAASKPHYRRLCHWLFKNSHVILLSRLLYGDIQSFVPEDRCFFVPNGIPAPTEPPARHYDASTDECIHLLYLSNMIYEKGPVVFAKALAILKQRGMPFKAVFAGAANSEECQAEFQSILDDNCLNEDVTYVGPQYGDEKAKLYAHSDALVFPTFYPLECFPVVILEAMSNGLAVVSTREGAIPEIVDDGVTGLLTDRCDPNDLADKLNHLIQNRQMQRSMGQAGLRKFYEQYTIERFESLIAETLLECSRRG